MQGTKVVNTAGALATAAGQAATSTAKDKDTVVKSEGSGKTALVDGKVVEATKAVDGGGGVAASTEPKKGTKKPAVNQKPKAGEAKAEAKDSDKLIAARRYFDKHKVDKDGKAVAAGIIAGGLAKELKMSYSNAYYYVTRVFGLKSTKPAK